MSEIIDCIKARSLITSFQSTSNNTLIYSTKIHGIKILSIQNCHVQVNFSNQFLNQDTTAITFNKTGTLVAFSSEKAIYIADLNTKEIIKIIPTETQKVQLLIFDDTSNHIIAGNDNGRVIQYNCLSTSAIARLCSFPYNETDRSNIRKNYVSAFAINKNRIASTGLGGSIIVIDMYSRANKIVLQNTRSRVNALHFLDDNTLIAGNFDGLISIFCIKEKKLIKEIQTPLHRIRQIISMPNKNFIMLCSNAHYVSIVDIINHKVLHNNYLEFNDQVLKIALLEDKNIAIALKDGTIKKIELTTEEDLKSLILHNSLDKAFELIEKEPMLKESLSYTKLEKIYKTIYNKAVIALINQNTSLANELLKMFKHLSSKNKEINSLYIAFKNYNNLKVLFVGKRLAIAYALCAKFPELENTPIFRKMEENWRDIFKSAQRQMLLHKPHNATSLLSEYKTIPRKKKMIDLVLHQNEEFIRFIVSIDKKDYAQASMLANKNKLLTQVPSYQVLQNELDFKLEQIKNFIYQGDIKKARIAIAIINDVVHLKKDTISLTKECRHLEILQKHYEKTDLKSCYKAMDMYPSLYSTQLGELLENHWKKLIEQCEEFALKGGIYDIKNLLGELITLKGRVEKIGDLFRLSFHVKIKNYLSKRSFKHTEKLIYSYLDTFGVDHEITQFMKKYEQKTGLKLAITHDITTNRNSWIHSDFIK